MPAEYTQSSAYYATSRRGSYLDVLTYRPIPKNSTDIPYIIDRVYEYRPDLLANDLYGDSKLWWVFAVRNPNTIIDPIYDFASGTTIYLPSKDALTSSLGI